MFLVKATSLGIQNDCYKYFKEKKRKENLHKLLDKLKWLNPW
jgi:hypothetical protein